MTKKWVTEAPPLCYTLNFGDAGDDAVVEGKRGQKNKQKKTWELDCEFQHSLTEGKVRGDRSPASLHPRKATHTWVMGGRQCNRTHWYP